MLQCGTRICKIKEVESMKSFGTFIRGKGFSTLFSIFSFLSIFYVADRVGRLSESIFHHDFRLIVFSLLAILMGYMLFYIKSKKEIKTTRNLYEICSVILCFLLYLVVFLWGYDFADLLFHIDRDGYYIIPVVLSIGLAFYGFLHAKKLVVKEYHVSMPQLEKKKKAVLLSDIHVGTFVDLQQLAKIVEKVNALQADLVLIAGDMFDVEAFAYCDKAAIAKVLQKLEPKENVFAVLGNHDPKSSTDEIKQFYKDAKIQLLIDQEVELKDFVLIGRDDVMTNPKRKSLYEIEKESSSRKPRIVIDHNPSGIAEAVAQKADLIVCGHTHKGQFFPANIFTKLAYGKQGYYGYYREKSTQSIVSSGVGYFQMPMRIGSNSEIVAINME